jgi:SecD/SecF fusion protein
MMKFFAKPNIDWVGKRKVFLAVSTVLVGLSLLSFGIETAVDKQGIYDIDFLGGTSVLVELRPDVKMNDEEVRKAVSAAGSAGQRTAVRFLNDAAAALEKSEVKPGSVSQQFIVSAAGLDGNEVATLVRAAQEDVLARGGVTVSGKSVTFDLKPERNLDLEGFKTVLHNSAAYARKAAERLASARVQSVKDIGEEAKTHDAYEIITVETNRELVQTAVVAALADKLSIEQAISFHLVTDPDRAPEGLFPIQEDDVYLGDVLGREANFDIRHFKGGVALVLDDLSPPQTVEKIDARLRNARLQPEFQGTEWRDYQIIGLVPAKTPEGEDGYRQIALVSVDERLPYYDDPTAWETRLAKPELAQARFAFAQEKALRKVIQFAPQVASQTQTQAFVAMFLAWVAIVAYLWIRFGTIQWGLAAIVALVHDVAIALGCVVLSHFVYNTIVGQALLLSDFKIDLPVVAALLTIIGFSVNDTIVIFDRVRENRGKLGALSASMINNSLNQTLSRTILTTLTAFVTVLIMYIWGGEGARGFSFVMMCGMISGTYSTVGIALPLLYRPVLLNVISAVIAALGLLGAVMLSGVGLYGQIVGGVIIAIALAATIVLMTRGRRTPRERGAPLPAAA